MTHYHVGFNLSGQAPEGEVATYRALDEAIAANHANAADIAAGFDQPTVFVIDADPDCPSGTSAWVTVGDDEFSYYLWVGKSEGHAGVSCDCKDGEAALVDLNDRDSLIAWHEWNDPNGVYRDEDVDLEGTARWTLEDLRSLYLTGELVER